MDMKKRIVGFLAALAAVVLAVPTQAGIAMFRAAPGSDMTMGAGTIWNTRTDAFAQAGWAFTAGPNVTINQLGMWIAPNGISGNQAGVANYTNGGSLTKDHTVAIYRFASGTATLLQKVSFAAGTSLPAGSDPNGKDQYAWQSIPALNLIQGQQYLVMASYTTAGDKLASFNYNAKAKLLEASWGTLSSTGYWSSSVGIPSTVGGTVSGISTASGENGSYGYVGPNIGYLEPSPYDLWKAAGFANVFIDNDPSQDPDHDGLNNYDEFVFGLDPTTGASSEPITAPYDRIGHTFRYTRYKNSGLQYTVSISTDLLNWQALRVTEPAELQETIVGLSSDPPNANVETVEVELLSPPDTNRLFMRVEAR